MSATTMQACLVHQADHNKTTVINNHCAANCGEGKPTCLVPVKFATGHFKDCHRTNSVQAVDKHQSVMQATPCE